MPPRSTNPTRTSAVTLERGDDVSRFASSSRFNASLSTSTERLRRLAKPPEERCRCIRRGTAGMPYQRQIEVVAKQRVALEPLRDIAHQERLQRSIGTCRLGRSDVRRRIKWVQSASRSSATLRSVRLSFA